MKRSTKNISVLVILLPLLLLAVTSIIVTNTFSFLKLTNTLNDQTLAQQHLETDYAATNIADHLHQVKMELTAMSVNPKTLLVDENNCSQGLTTINGNFDGLSNNLFITDSLGNVKGCSTDRFDYYLGLNIQNQDYFSQPLKTKEPFISGILNTGQDAYIIVSVPLYETASTLPYPDVSGKFSGVIFSIIEVDELYLQHIHPFVDGEKRFFVLYDTYNEKIIYQDLGLERVNKDFFSDASTRRKIREEEYVITTSPAIFDNQQWSLSLFTKANVFEAQTRPITIRHIIGLIVIIMLLILVFILVFSLYRSRENILLELNKANVTLKNLGLEADIESGLFVNTDMNLKSKTMYLIQDNADNQVFELFIAMLNKGFKGLGMIRENPDQFRKKYNVQKTPLVWLSKTHSKHHTTEHKPSNVFNLATEFITKNSPSIVLIDRIDFLLQEDAQVTIKALQELKDLTSTHDSIVLIHLPKGIVNAAVESAVVSETVDVLGKDHLLQGVSLSEQELSMLKFINERNVANKLVSYNDITKEYSITKPTTRSRIASLQAKNLVIVSQRGRYKTLSITSTGRRIIN